MVRRALLLLLIIAIAAAAWVAWSGQQRTNSIEASTRRFDALVRSLTIGAGDLRAAQQSYVAAGQGEDFWFARVASLLTDISGRLPDLKSSARSPEGAAAVDEAVVATQDLQQVDRRVRDLLRTRQTTAASDLIFADGFDFTHKIVDALGVAGTAESAAADRAVARLRQIQAGATAGAAVFSMLVASLLLRVPTARTRDVPVVTAPVAAPVSAVTAADPKPDQDRQEAPGPAVDLPAIASLCADLSRLTETRSLPALIERASQILDANGIVLWIADPDGHELAPIIIQGYPPQLATRMGMMKRDAENVTAAAYRTALLQTVKRDAHSNGAVAAPLISPAGCVGVLAAEIQHGGEQQPALLAAATIIASQLATLVGPPAARKAEATG